MVFLLGENSKEVLNSIGVPMVCLDGRGPTPAGASAIIKMATVGYHGYSYHLHEEDKR